MLLIKPYLGCNLKCAYCYERDLRKQEVMHYDLPKVLEAMGQYKDLQMTLHGGEPLCMPKEDVESIFKKTYELQNRSSIQTNGMNIDANYIELFKKYKTSVGISFDGEGELSSYRMSQEKAVKLMNTIREMRKQDIQVSVIAIISKSNAEDDEKLKRLKEWLVELDDLRICGRLNPCGGALDCELSPSRLIEVYLDLAEFCVRNNFRWSPFIDIVNRLLGKSAVCTFMGCDPFHTPSATVLLGDGSVTNCMRTNEKGILLHHPAQYDTRDELLQEIPQKFGGCKGCEFFYACHGGCPSIAIDSDWRNRTYLCPLWKELFKYYRNILNFCNIDISQKQPQSTPRLEYERQHPDRKPILGRPGWYHGDSPHGDSN